MSSRQKICFVIHSLGIGGMERVMALLIQEISQRPNVEIHLMLIGRNREIKQNIPSTVIIHKPSWKFRQKLRFLYTIKTLIFIRSTIKHIRPFTVLSMGEMWNNLVLLALLRTNYPVFISDRSKPDKNLGKLQNWLRDYLYPKAVGFVAQTEKSAEVAVIKKWNSNIKIIGNPVPTIDLGIPKGHQVVTVGRLIRTKNVDRLIEIFAQVSHETTAKGWKLCIIGGNAAGGKILEQLHEQREKLNLSNIVLLEGEKNNVNDYLKNSEIFAFTSTSEGFPNALAEAMSAGLAVIAYDCIAGPSDLIDDGVNGFLIPVGNETLFAEKLSELINNEELRKRFGCAAKLKMSCFHQTKIAENFYKFILNIN